MIFIDIIIIIVSFIFLLLSGPTLFTGKKCHNREHQPVFLGLGIVGSFFSYHIHLLFQVNKAVMLLLSSPSPISVSVCQSALSLFLMPFLRPV